MDYLRNGVVNNRILQPMKNEILPRFQTKASIVQLIGKKESRFNVRHTAGMFLFPS